MLLAHKADYAAARSFYCTLSSHVEQKRWELRISGGVKDQASRAARPLNA